MNELLNRPTGPTLTEAVRKCQEAYADFPITIPMLKKALNIQDPDLLNSKVRKIGSEILAILLKKTHKGDAASIYYSDVCLLKRALAGMGLD